MIEINLIPDVKQELLRAQRLRSIVISVAIFTSIATAGLVVALVIYTFGVQTVRHTFLDQAIKDGNTELSKIEDLSKTLTIQNQLGVISTLSESKRIDSRLFDVLTGVIPPAPNNVQVSNLILNSGESSLMIEGQTQGYDSLEIFKKTVDAGIIVYTQEGEEQKIKLAEDVTTYDVSYGENSEGQKVLRFTMKFSYPVELFSAAIPAVSIKLSVEGNVTDSYLGVPKSIFAERAKDLEE